MVASVKRLSVIFTRDYLVFIPVTNEPFLLLLTLGSSLVPRTENSYWFGST